MFDKCYGERQKTCQGNDRKSTIVDDKRNQRRVTINVDGIK